MKLRYSNESATGYCSCQLCNDYDSRLKDWIRRFDSYLGWFRAIDRTRGAGLNPASLLASAVRP